MSKIIVVYANKKNGKFEFTKEELEALLDDAYNKGYTQGKSDTFVWQSPTITAVPPYTGATTIDLKSNKYDVKY